jgi:hypothetical protein
MNAFLAETGRQNDRQKTIIENYFLSCRHAQPPPST